MQKTGLGRTSTHTAVYALDASNPKPNNTATVAWPAMNMPMDLTEDSMPFSLSLGTNFAAPIRDNITITMTRERDHKSWIFDQNSSSVPAEEGYFLVENSRYGQNKCLIWRPALDDTDPLYRRKLHFQH